MREILFRGKSLYDNEWIEGFYVHANEAYGKDVDRHFIIKHGEFEYDNYDAWEVIPETVGQFTGLFANGKKIFEGDIIRHGKKYGFVNYLEGCFCVKQCAPKENRNNPAIDIIFEKHPNDIEIIGNGYDNPEHLRSENK